MKPKIVASRIRALEKCGRTPMLLGGPGIGKTEIVNGLCVEDEIECVEIILSQMSAVDMKFPVVNRDRGVVEWYPAEELVREGPCRYFFDELPNAPLAVQQAGYQIFLKGALGRFKLDKSPMTTKGGHTRPMHTVIAAGNRAEDLAFVNPMPSPLRNRMVLLGVTPDFTDWRDWAWESEIASIVINFLTYAAREHVAIDKDADVDADLGLLYVFDPKRHSTGQFPTPRTWEFVSDYVKANPELATDSETISGMVGEGAATKFTAFVEVADQLPNAEEIIAGNINIEPPNAKRQAGALYAYCGALVASLLRVKDKDQRLEATGHVAEYCVKWWSNDEEFAVLTMRDFGRTQYFREIYRKVITTKPWQKFTQTFKDLMVG